MVEFRGFRVAAITAVSLFALASGAHAQVTLNVVTAGDQNMVDYVIDFLGPKFEAKNPGVKVRAIGTGPGDAGSQAVFEKLKAQKSQASWDVDVAVVHQFISGPMLKEDLLAKYTGQIASGALATRDSAKNALGANVEGYVIPMFNSQVAVAYNPDMVKEPPTTYQQLAEWAKANPKKFGYNGIKGGMSGVGFVTGWMYAFAPSGLAITTGYDANAKAGWKDALASLKDFNKNATITPGNAGTLDMLGRGEIAMGPVWVDMFYSWMADGKLNPNTKLVLLGPGMPGQPMYYTLPAKATHKDLALKFIDFAASPEIQAEGIVKRFNWYPGIDAQHVQKALDQKTWNKLFTDVTPADLATKGKTFPVAAHLKEIQESYEASVTQ
ncbi:ABC transporter substrate-binding protein [Elstera litoralis]|uniref:ABC transporter substrate-binding protein n=1 Tax=Elstera litoralis TaxID=552518 RepID=A0A0F3IZQ6_9PROT|nr:extracellular solute-binding protein [Elstera litoralis]KJV11074.1 ABC transporter substrate-binding protein [Elstera litoralis]